MRIDAVRDLTPADRAAVLAPLDAHSRAAGFAWTPEAFALVLRDEAGRAVGGLIGQLHWGWLRIDILAVAEPLRGGGWGRRLVAEAERAAGAAGCRRAWVDTFSFQAPGFYERLGYREFGRLPDYPEGQTRIFLAKELVDSGPPPVSDEARRPPGGSP
ncbi:MAG: GNAT family N-acetyltransferase [Gemmataceae bacterium]